MKTLYQLHIGNLTLTGTAQEILSAPEIVDHIEVISNALGQIASGVTNSVTHYACACIAPDFELTLLVDARLADLREAFRTLIPPLMAPLKDTLHRYCAITANNDNRASSRFALAHLTTFVESL